MAIVFISHRLREVFEIAEKISVLKDGELVGTVMTKDTNTSEIVHMMVGRDLDHYFPPLGSPEDFGEVVLRVKDGGNDFLKDINFELRKGEVLCVAGLQGSGRTELAHALFGVVPFKTGTIEVNGKIQTIKIPPDAIRLHMGFVTEDRKAEGILPKQPIRDNILLTVRTLQPFFGFIYKDGIRKTRHSGPGFGQSGGPKSRDLQSRGSISQRWQPTKSGSFQVALLKVEHISFLMNRRAESTLRQKPAFTI